MTQLPGATIMFMLASAVLADLPLEEEALTAMGLLQSDVKRLQQDPTTHQDSAKAQYDVAVDSVTLAAENKEKSKIAARAAIMHDKASAKATEAKALTEAAQAAQAKVDAADAAFTELKANFDQSKVDEANAVEAYHTAAKAAATAKVSADTKSSEVVRLRKDKVEADAALQEATEMKKNAQEASDAAVRDETEAQAAFDDAGQAATDSQTLVDTKLASLTDETQVALETRISEEKGKAESYGTAKGEYAEASAGLKFYSEQLLSKKEFAAEKGAIKRKAELDAGKLREAATQATDAAIAAKTKADTKAAGVTVAASG